MKKLFISCPMKGRTEENIKKSMKQMHEIAEIVFGQKLEAIDSFIEEQPPEGTVNIPVWYLGKSIGLLAQADYFIGIYDYCDYFKGCRIEAEIARNYGIRPMFIEAKDVMPDVVEIMNNYWRNPVPTCQE